MSSKEVYSYHQESGIYTGKVLAYESPLEPGIYHIPALATEKNPPLLKDDELAYFINGKWQIKKFEIQSEDK